MKCKDNAKRPNSEKKRAENRNMLCNIFQKCAGSKKNCYIAAANLQDGIGRRANKSELQT